jgi:CBS-domain-containing membrane protein
MKSYRVKDLMVSLSEYATVLETATLLDAVKALREAQAAFGQDRYRHRAILVFDGNKHFVGKLSQHDVIEALEPNYKDIKSSADHGAMHRLGFSDDFVKSTLEQYHLWEKALENLCEKAVHLKVKDIMYAPGKSEFVNERTTMDEAIHRLIVGRHHSLLVSADRNAREIVGVLRLADVFEFVSDAMHECVEG